ncbi:hypothetical protein LshimejAT787_0200180 [Lyophyllum shimeji]|uniref:Uncharacterized protein n=1 Tax=Lyophyllum shimeji TaxID=47721 RepID=A0A9P3PEJ1_LYOSH|nr:hypothetical protein LshimejAT787_0200180 [Lyophyllum shimeji]
MKVFHPSPCRTILSSVGNVQVEQRYEIAQEGLAAGRGGRLTVQEERPADSAANQNDKNQRRPSRSIKRLAQQTHPCPHNHRHYCTPKFRCIAALQHADEFQRSSSSRWLEAAIDMGAPSPLPTDVVQTIFEELTYDHQSLKHCASVSRVFLHWSRQHLFRVIRLVYDAFRSLLGCTSLIALSFSGMFTRDFPVDILAIPPALTSLTFIQIWPDTFASEDRSMSKLPMPQRAATKLRTLELTGGSTSRLVKHLTQPHCPVQLCDLYCHPESLERLTWLNRIYIARDTDVNASESTSKLDLQRMQKLATLDLQLYPYRTHCQWATRIVRDWGLPPSLERVSLKFEGTHFEILPKRFSVDEIEKTFLREDNGLDDALAALCNREAYPSLRKILIEVQIPKAEVRNKDARLLEESYIGKWFPRVKATGLLDGSCVPR